MRMSARKRSLGALHAGKRKLGWDDATYRALLDQVTGKHSAADCSDTELGAMLDFMRTRGFARQPGFVAPPARSSEDPAAGQLAKIHELWDELASKGALSEPSESALRAFGHRVTGAQALKFMTVAQRIKVIEGLKAWLRRVGTRRSAAAGE